MKRKEKNEEKEIKKKKIIVKEKVKQEIWKEKGRTKRRGWQIFIPQFILEKITLKLAYKRK